MLKCLITYSSNYYYVTLIAWLEQNMLPCYFKYFFGIDCPGCGLQRSTILLLKGNLWESIQMYPPLLPIVFVVLIHFFNKSVSYYNQALLFKITVWSVAGIVAINFVYKFVMQIKGLLI